MKQSQNYRSVDTTPVPPLPALTGNTSTEQTILPQEHLTIPVILVNVLVLIFLEIVGTLAFGLIGAYIWGGSMLNVLCAAGIASVLAYAIIAQYGRQPLPIRTKRVLTDAVVTGFVFTGIAFCFQFPSPDIYYILLINIVAGPLGFLFSLALAPPRQYPEQNVT
jgi:hypothetical protein